MHPQAVVPRPVAPTARYYGWANLALAALAMVATLPGRTQGLGLITEPLLTDLRLDRVTYATYNLWATLIGAAFCLPFGRWTDRLGSRAVITGLMLGLGATVLAMSQTFSPWMIFITMTLTRGLGQSALSIASLALVGKWFARRLHLAMGIYSLLVGIGFIAAFPSVGAVVQGAGWRTAWLGVGAALVAACAPLAWIFVRDSSDATEDVEGLKNEPSDLTPAQALRSPAFWIFALSSSVFGLVYSGIALFNQSILEQRGFDATTYYNVLVLSTMIGLAANFAGGWLASFWAIQKLMCVGMVVLGVALVSLPMVRTQAHVTAYALTMGVAGGIVTVVFFSVWGQVFGRTHLGKIQGYAQMMTVLASAVGPLLLAETLKSTGSYDLIFNSLAAAVAILALGCWLTPLPRRDHLGAIANAV
jgi:MFS family permease